MRPMALDNPKGLVVLIQDQGVIRAGQWSRKLIVHRGLEQGSQIPFIKKTLGDSCGVIVMNPNDNFHEIRVEEEYCTDP
ncbi:F172A protein, partial [Polyodon spathula]|nr:F172A protein [Polyodon spathula]